MYRDVKMLHQFALFARNDMLKHGLKDPKLRYARTPCKLLLTTFLLSFDIWMSINQHPIQRLTPNQIDMIPFLDDYVSFRRRVCISDPQYKCIIHCRQWFLSFGSLQPGNGILG